MKTIFQRNLLPSLSLHSHLPSAPSPLRPISPPRGGVGGGLLGVGSWGWALFLFLTLSLVSCSKDNEDTEPEATSTLQPGNDSRPTTWTAPNYSLFEYRMAVQVQLGDTLAAFQSGADLICAKIGGEVRAVAEPQSTGGVIYYPLHIAGDGSDQTISLHYYCDQLHRIYTINNWATFNASAAPTGDTGFYRPCFINE